MDDPIAELIGGAEESPASVAPDDQRATESELATLFGVSPRTVRELARKGIVERAEGKGYRLRGSVASYCAHLRETAAARSESGTLSAERLRLTRERADEAALKNAKLRGDLLDAREVENEWGDVLRTVRARLLAVPARVQSRAAGFDAAAIEVVREEVKAALNELGSG